MRTFVVLLRVFALLLALASAALAGYAAYQWNEGRRQYAAAQAEMEAAGRQRDVEVGKLLLDRGKLAQEQEKTENRHRTLPFLAGAVVFGFVGALFALVGRTNSAAALLLAATAGPLILFPDPTTAVVMSGFGLGGVLCLVAGLLRPKRPRPAVAEEA